MATKNPGKYFIRNDVRNILQRVTGFDLNKIFKNSFNPKLDSSKIQLLTKKQLDEENKKAFKKASEILQMPPYLSPRQRCDNILSQDERLNPLNLTNTKYMFIDISMNISDEKRSIVVREVDGTLRNANHDEREKLLQVYYPKPGKSIYVPQMFSPLQLEECLKLKNYLILLNKACVKFEPDDPEFIRITHRIYEYINEVKDFEVLYSTRFYGPMVFYLAWYKKLENIISHTLNKPNLRDCLDIIHLYHILNESTESLSNSLNFIHEFVKNESSKANNNESEALNIITKFIKKELKNSASAELALSKYIETNKTKNETIKSIN